MSIQGASSTALTPESPWPGLRPFYEEEYGYFRGREPEQDAVVEIVLRAPVTVLYGQSGLGKTSLLRAGVGPRVRDRGILPVYVRLDHADGAPPLSDQLKQALSSALDREQVRGPALEVGVSLWEFFHRRGCEFWGSRNRLITPLFVIDQFEEIFTIGARDAVAKRRVSAFIDEIECLLEHRPPAAVRERLERAPEGAEFFDFRQDRVKFLFALREDFLPHFDQLRRRIPSLLKHRFRLERMNGAQARSVVNAGGQLVTPEVADRIVDFVSGSRNRVSGAAEDRHVEPALLSVVLDELNRRRVDRGEPSISPALLAGAQESIIQDFYDRAFRGLDDAIRDWIEAHLLTTAGYRDRAALDDGLRAGIPERAFAALVDHRVLQREEKDGITWVELTHDLLTGPAAESRTLRQRKREARDAARQREDVERQLIRSRRLATVFGLLLVVAVAAMALAYWQYSNARAAQLSVLSERDRALALEQEASATAIRAEASARDATANFESALGTADSLGRLVTDSLRLDMRMTTASAVQAVDRAETAFRALLGRDSDSETLKNHYGGFLASAAWSLMESGLIDAAEALLDRAAEVVDTDIPSDASPGRRLVAGELLIARGRVRVLQGSLDSAQAAAAQSMSTVMPLATDDVRAQRVLARAHLLSGRIDLLGYQRARAIGHFVSAAGSFRNAPAGDREARHIRLQSLIGQAEAEANDFVAIAKFEAADAQIQDVLKGDPGDLSVLRLSSEVTMRAGWTSAALGRRFDADEYYNRAHTAAANLAKHDPDNLDWTLNLARVERALGLHTSSRAGAAMLETAQKRIQPLLDRQPRWRLARYTAALLQYDLTPWLHARLDAQRESYAQALRALELLVSTTGDALGRRALALTMYQLAYVTEGEDRRRWLSRLEQTLALAGSVSRGEPDLLEVQSFTSAAMAVASESTDADAALRHRRRASEASLTRAKVSGNPDHLREAAVRLLEEREALALAGQFDRAELRFREALATVTQASARPSAPGADPLARARLEASTSRMETGAGRTAEALESATRALDFVWKGLREAPNHRLLVTELQLLRRSLESMEPDTSPALASRIQTLLTHYNSKGPVDWIMQPLFPAEWRNVDNLETAARYITAQGVVDNVRPSQVLAVREAPLAFRANGSIFEAAIETARGEIKLAAVLRTPGLDLDGRPTVVPFRLTGRSDSIHEMNKDQRTRLDSREGAEQYVRFFMAMLQGDDGTFALVEDVDSIPWTSEADEAIRTQTGKKIARLALAQSDNGEWRGSGTVLYNRSLYRVGISLQPTGHVVMTEDTEVADALPVLVERFENGLRVRETQHESLVRLYDREPPSSPADLQRAVRGFAGSRDWRRAARLQRDLIAALTDLKRSQRELAGAWLDLSWYLLLSSDFSGALAAGDSGLRVAPSDIRLDSNRAHALLFLNRRSAAEALYRRHSGKRTVTDELWDNVILDDFTLLEETGLTHPGMDRIRGFLKPQYEPSAFNVGELSPQIGTR